MAEDKNKNEGEQEQKAVGPNETSEGVKMEPFVDPNSGAAPQPGSAVSSGGGATSVPEPEAVSRAQSEGAVQMAEQEREAQAQNREIDEAGQEARAKAAEKVAKSNSKKSGDKDK